MPGRAEAETLTGIACSDVRSAAQAGRRLLNRSTDAARVKLGGGGGILTVGEAATHIPGAPVELTFDPRLATTNGRSGRAPGRAYSHSPLLAS